MSGENSIISWVTLVLLMLTLNDVREKIPTMKEVWFASRAAFVTNVSSTSKVGGAKTNKNTSKKVSFVNRF